MVRFVPLGAPPDEEVEAILRRVLVRLLRLLRPWAERMDLEPPDALANAQAEALLLPSAAPQEPPRRKQHSAFLEGFSLHAGCTCTPTTVRLCSAFAPTGLARHCRWSGWPRCPMVALPTDSSARSGTAARCWCRSAPASDAGAAAPPPPGPLPRSFRTQRVLARSYRAPPAGSRSTLCRRGVRRARTAARASRVEASGPSAPPFPWAELQRRVFREEVLECNRCGGRRVLLAFLIDRSAVKAILEHLRLATTGPPVARPDRRGRPWSNPRLVLDGILWILRIGA
jgi:hypothetical protein